MTDKDIPTAPPDDPLPNPEPISPSLDQPDPGVFHHDPVKPPATTLHHNVTPRQPLRNKTALEC
jgi:hypothetical protein